MCVIFSELRTLWSEVSKSGLQWDLWDCDDCTSCVLDRLCFGLLLGFVVLLCQCLGLRLGLGMELVQSSSTHMVNLGMGLVYRP